MKRFSFLRCAQRLLSAGLFIAFSSAAVWAKNMPQESPGVAIFVFNDSGISSEILQQAEKVSSKNREYKLAGSIVLRRTRLAAARYRAGRLLSHNISTCALCDVPSI